MNAAGAWPRRDEVFHLTGRSSESSSQQVRLNCKADSLVLCRTSLRVNISCSLPRPFMRVLPLLMSTHNLAGFPAKKVSRL